MGSLHCFLTLFMPTSRCVPCRRGEITEQIVQIFTIANTVITVNRPSVLFAPYSTFSNSVPWCSGVSHSQYGQQNYLSFFQQAQIWLLFSTIRCELMGTHSKLYVLPICSWHDGEDVLCTREGFSHMTPCPPPFGPWLVFTFNFSLSSVLPFLSPPPDTFCSLAWVKRGVWVSKHTPTPWLCQWLQLPPLNVRKLDW